MRITSARSYIIISFDIAGADALKNNGGTQEQGERTEGDHLGRRCTWFSRHDTPAFDSRISRRVGYKRTYGKQAEHRIVVCSGHQCSRGDIK